MSLQDRLLNADDLGIRLETVNGLAIWEAQPLYRHQKHVERASIKIPPKPECITR